MRIAFISAMSGAPWGGSEELWSRAAFLFLKRGHTVASSTKYWPIEPHQIAQLRTNGASVNLRRTDTIVRRIVSRLRDPAEDFLKLSRPDLVVISQGANSDGLPWMEACARANVPYVSIAHNAPPWCWPVDEIAERLRAAYLGARKTLFVSHENLALTERQIVAKLPNAEVVRNPFNVPYDASLQWPDKDYIQVACVARLDTYSKGHDILFDVMSETKWRERNLRVALYGRGPNERTLREECTARALTAVAFAGFVPDPLHIWRSAHCLILPSRAEGFPLVVVEAMLCARPCIVSNAAGNPELLEDNITGFIAKTTTPAGLDEALERAWALRHQWQDIGKRAALAVREMVPSDPVQVFVDLLLSLA